MIRYNETGIFLGERIGTYDRLHLCFLSGKSRANANPIYIKKYHCHDRTDVCPIDFSIRKNYMRIWKRTMKEKTVMKHVLTELLQNIGMC